MSRLNALGFPWSCAAERWDQRYNELVEYLQNHNGVWPKTVWKKGGVKARSEAEASQHALAQWVSAQRQQYNQTGIKAKSAKKKNLPHIVAMRKAQQAKLSSLGMNWASPRVHRGTGNNSKKSQVKKPENTADGSEPKHLGMNSITGEVQVGKGGPKRVDAPRAV